MNPGSDKDTTIQCDMLFVPEDKTVNMDLVKYLHELFCGLKRSVQPRLHNICINPFCSNKWLLFKLQQDNQSKKNGNSASPVVKYLCQLSFTGRPC